MYCRWHNLQWWWPNPKRRSLYGLLLQHWGHWRSNLCRFGLWNSTSFYELHPASNSWRSMLSWIRLSRSMNFWLLKKLEIYFIACFKPVFETFLIANQIVRLNIMPHIQFVIWKRWRQFQFCCLFWYRHRLPKSLRNLLLIGQMCHALKTKLNTNPERICHPMIHADLAFAGLEENIVPNQIVKDLKGLILQCNQKMSFEIEIFCWFSNTVSGLNYRCHTSSSWHEVRTLSFRSGWHQKYFAILGHDAIYCCEIILH